jgi:hypothetical protein
MREKRLCHLFIGFLTDGDDASLLVDRVLGDLEVELQSKTRTKINPHVSSKEGEVEKMGRTGAGPRRIRPEMS